MGGHKDTQVFPSAPKLNPGLQTHLPLGPTDPLGGQVAAVEVQAVLSALNCKPGLQTHSPFLTEELGGQLTQAGSPLVLNTVLPRQTQVLLLLGCDPLGQRRHIPLINPYPLIQPQLPLFFLYAFTPHWLMQPGPTLINPGIHSQTPDLGLYC